MSSSRSSGRHSPATGAIRSWRLGAVGALGVLVSLAVFFEWPTPKQVLALPQTACDVVGAVGESVGIAITDSSRWCRSFKPAPQPDEEAGEDGATV